MRPITCTTRIEASPEKVFEACSDMRRAAERIKAIKRLEVLTDGPIRKGTKFRETRIMFGKEATETMEITAFDPPQSYTVEGDSCGAHFVSRFDLRPDGAGTLVEFTVSVKATSVLAKIMSPLSAMMRGSMKKLFRQELDDIKAAVESGR
jgi:carbon monoxide dehydrogenase subunit G